MRAIDPFTRTPGLAGKAYIDNGVADDIIYNFMSNESSKYVYKITGVRGSGKSVEYSKIIKTLKNEKKWLVYPLSSSGDVINTLISKLAMESFIDSDVVSTEISSGASINGNAVIVSGNGSINAKKTITKNDHFYSDEAALTKMITVANDKGYKILIGVDDIFKTQEMIKLLSIIGSMLLEGLRVYLVVTGLSDNIEDFSNEKNLSFFKRADEKEIKALNKYDITHMYEKLLGIDTTEAKKLESITNGYAYAYQVMGTLYFSKKKTDTIEDILPDFERILFKDSYDLIWNSLTEGEKELVRCICESGEGKVDSIRNLMSNPSSYSVYRSRLLNKHIVDGDTRGYLKLRLPLFNKFVELWGE